MTGVQTCALPICYFSGSITHNEDFDLVIPSLVKIFEKYPQVYLKIAGILDVPNALDPYKERLITSGFVDWRELPAVMAECDIVLAPLVDTIFNRAKSENKWVEAALVKIPTIASNIGAFAEKIQNNETGILVNNTDAEWFKALNLLVSTRFCAVNLQIKLTRR